MSEIIIIWLLTIIVIGLLALFFNLGWSGAKKIHEIENYQLQAKVEEYEALLVDIEAIALNRVDCCGGLDDIREMVKNKLNE